MIILYIIIILYSLYSCLILYFWKAWKSIPNYSASDTIPQTSISIIIPARNEEKNIGALLLSLQQQSYPRGLFEIIVVDDHSTDGTVGIVQQYPLVKLIKLMDDNLNSFKKKAIETGIAASVGNLIITTDADCIPARNWLRTIALFKEEKESVLIAAPVVF
ncbi:MAG: glycosyltransferase, partial [Chitinophagaceae bacterium]